MMTITDRAREIVRSYLDRSGGELQALRISSRKGSEPLTPNYELTLIGEEDWNATDVEFDAEDFTVLVERETAQSLMGATVDFVERPTESGFKITPAPPESRPETTGEDSAPATSPGPPGPRGSPLDGDGPTPPGGPGGVPGGAPTSSPSPPEGPELEDPPQGPLADRVRSVLDERINPAIAMHGGRITLVDVEDTEISIVMSGGCQGCALSRRTLKQGVEKMVHEEIPEVTAIHDVTDHQSGENPFYS